MELKLELCWLKCCGLLESGLGSVLAPLSVCTSVFLEESAGVNDCSRVNDWK